LELCSSLSYLCLCARLPLTEEGDRVEVEVVDAVAATAAAKKTVEQAVVAVEEEEEVETGQERPC
jgi:hypothetical protein